MGASPRPAVPRTLKATEGGCSAVGVGRGPWGGGSREQSPAPCGPRCTVRAQEGRGPSAQATRRVCALPSEHTDRFLACSQWLPADPIFTRNSGTQGDGPGLASRLVCGCWHVLNTGVVLYSQVRGHIWGCGGQIFKATELPKAAGLGLKVLPGSHRDCVTCLKADRPGPASVMGKL